MRRLLVSLLLGLFAAGVAQSAARRIFILKVDGLNADLLAQTMDEQDPQTGKSKLPWLSYIFRQNGTVFSNFYVRGISLSAPSWSMLDSGYHTVIRGNVEFDRYTGEVYDYLNFFPFYLENARAREQDMPGVRVLDNAGIPLLIDRFPPLQVFQSFQLFQRLVLWQTLANALKARFSSKSILSTIEAGDAPSLDQALAQQTERDLLASAHRPDVHYLDFYTGDVDHEGHATNQRAALVRRLQALDAFAGRVWSAIEETRDAGPTLFVMVSDHGMNNDPAVFSQAFSLPDLLNSPEGGAHHVVTNRHPLSDYKLRGLNPLVRRVITPSTASFYLKGESGDYPTAWLDLDGNERASLHLRNSDLNELHILLLQLARADLPATVRRAASAGFRRVVERNRSRWMQVESDMGAELTALQTQMDARSEELKLEPKHWTSKQYIDGTRASALRRAAQLEQWKQQKSAYQHYLERIKALLTLDPPAGTPFTQPVRDFIPELSLGDNNNVYQLQNYVVGPASAGLVVDSKGDLDEMQSFRRVNYFDLLAKQRVRNNPQPALNPNPIDFVIRRLPDGAARQFDPAAWHAYWISGNENQQLIVLSGRDGQIALRPVSHLTQNAADVFAWQQENWRAGLPLHLLEDPALQLPQNVDRGVWLSQWHPEADWFAAIHECLYSNGVIGITEEFSPIAGRVPGVPGEPELLLRYERRRRELVEPDLQIFAANHWNFNTRNFNPGGNHGSFFRISTHSVWMMAGDGVPVTTITEPEDSLAFASTILTLLGQTPPMPERVVPLPQARP